MPGLLQHRLVIPGVGSSFAPGDPDPLPDTDFYITSKYQEDHNWIADDGSGIADIATDGQRLDPITGHVEDGETQVRVIDQPAPIFGCDYSQIDLLDGVGIFETPSDWTEETSLGAAGCTNPTTGLPYNDGADYCVGPTGATTIDTLPDPNTMSVAIFLLFNWNDDHAGGSPYGNPNSRDVWRTRTMTGLTPGVRVGVTLRTSVALNTNDDWEPFLRIIGTTTEEWAGHLSDNSFWTFQTSFYEPAIDGLFLSTIVPPSGEVTLQFGVANLHPSGNINITFHDVQFAQCTPTQIGSEATPYVTGWLGDEDARQQLLGRKAYLEESLDGGTTWTRVLFAGYVKQIQMPASLTYIFTLGDSGRGRRVSRAWSDLDPTEDFTP